MGFINDIRKKLADRAIRSAVVRDREKVPVSLSGAKSCAIIYRADNPEEEELVKKYVKYLRDYKLSVKALGYFDFPKMPEGVNPKLEYDYFTKKDLNLLLQPTGKVVANFIEEPYDILIDTSINAFLPFKYIVSQSQAKFKVGRKELEYSSSFDFMIKVEEGKDLRYLLRYIDHYLNIINKE
ncbi:MAG: hypothetical protein NT150_06180 [Bacteroidetes bacterium]|nr:hypothetical protein [Bacteroidota bacterium]